MDDFTRDPELSALLRGAAGEPPARDVDWEALRARIGAQAELPLAQRRRAAAPRPAWRPRVLVPLVAAAAVAALALGLRPDARPLTPGDREVVQEIVDASLPENLDAVISGEAAQMALLEAAVGS